MRVIKNNNGNIDNSHIGNTEKYLTVYDLYKFISNQNNYFINFMK